MMNDSELITAVRESVAEVHTATPVEQILSRGRVVRARRRISALAAVLAAAAVAAVAVTVLPASHPAANQPGVRLAAWTVARRPDGDITVTIRELYNPAGLQRELRADGVPAVVTFHAAQRYPSSCQVYPASQALLSKVFPLDVRDPSVGIMVRPSALPTGAAMYLNDSSPHGDIRLQMGLVHASKRCTGS
jgi:hypothetical protein